MRLLKAAPPKPWIRAMDTTRRNVAHVWFEPEDYGHDLDGGQRCFCDPVTEHFIGGGQVWSHRRVSV